ncbi:MAG: amino acid ABC transporter [Cereibacter sphaeroides]|uniref:Amino acid ABC transporter n=1 Tax=Cereibacter sphaeroides TaxID=1063 RepID=A0A2W5SBD3_CERSP|nr:MAG: amino acid ABC transporter [Cereibacter sphaeroides]
MKKTLLAVAATLALSGAALAEPVKVGVAAEPYPPFSSPDASGKWVGWEIDMIGAVCAAAEMECVVTPVAWDGIIPALTSGQIDAIMASMSITDERKQTIDFSNKYYKTPAMIAAAKGSGITPTAEGLKGKILGVQVSTTHQAYAQAHFADSAAEIKTYQTQDEAYQDLIAGRIDATQADSNTIDTFMETAEGQACCENIGAVPDDPAILGNGVGVGLRKGDTALMEKFNAGIAKVLADGTYEKISAPYFKSSIYGN